MASATETPAPRRATLAAIWVTRALGAALFAAVAWQAILVVATPPRQYAALGFWLLVGSSLAIWVPCGIGGVILLRGRPAGFRYLYVAAALVIAGEMVILVPSVSFVLGPPRYGGVGRNWPLVLALLILLVLAHRVILRYLPATPAKPWRLLAGPLGLLLALLPVGGLCFSGRQQLEEQAGGPVQRGIEAYEAGRHDEAVVEWEQVIARYPYTSAWGVAVFNTGYDLRERHRYREAIARFEELLGSRLDDWDPSGYLMEAYQNYHHQACLEISSCYEALGDYPSALRFAELARDRYPYRSWCGTCLREERGALEDRIERLSQQGGGAR